MNNTKRSDMPPVAKPEAPLVLNQETIARLKAEVARGLKLFVTGASGTGKSYVQHALKGFDLDWTGSHEAAGWTIHPEKIPADTKLVAGCFESPSYAEFVAYWKPDKVYLLTTPLQDYKRVYLRKASEKAAVQWLVKSAGITRPKAATHHPWQRAEGDASELKAILEHVPNKLRESRIDYTVITNAHSADAGSAWHSEYEPVSISQEVLGLAVLAAEGSKLARSLLVMQATDPVLNPRSWKKFCQWFEKEGIRLNPTVRAKWKAASSKSSPWRKYAHKK